MVQRPDGDIYNMYVESRFCCVTWARQRHATQLLMAGTAILLVLTSNIADTAHCSQHWPQRGGRGSLIALATAGKFCIAVSNEGV